MWTLAGRTSTASADSRTLRSDDGVAADRQGPAPGRRSGPIQPRDRRRARRDRRGVGHLGTTGDVSVPAGRHRVGEEGVDGTSLADYDTTIACRANRGRGRPVSARRGPELIVDVAAGQEVVCTIVNSRRTGPPVPPDPTPPGPTPPPTPEPGTSDLAVQKFVSARVAALGEIVEWTVVVTNNGPLTATGVTILDDAAAGATIVSLQVRRARAAGPPALWARSRRVGRCASSPALAC